MFQNKNKVLFLITACILYLGVCVAQPTCQQKYDWCLHDVKISNNSSKTVDVWCHEVGCDDKKYHMGSLSSGKSFYGNPNAYNAKFSVSHNDNTIKSFTQLEANGYCNNYEFHLSDKDFCGGSFGLEASHDKSICKGQSVEICGENANSYWWSNGSDKRCITVSPDHSKTYTLTGRKNGCDETKDVKVTVNDSFNLEVSDDQTICKGQSIKICGENADGYWWSNGSDHRCITVSPDHTKTFTVTGVKNGCEATKDVKVTVNNIFNLEVSDDQTICKGESVKICGENADGYWWSNDSDHRCITVSPDHTKTFTLSGVKNGCEANRDVKVTVNDNFEMPSSDDQTICRGQSVEICGSGADHYDWNTGDNTACITVSPHETTTYTLIGSKNGCKDNDPIKVNVNGSISLDTSHDPTICAGQSVEICASGADGYWWSNAKDKRCITVSPDHTKTYSVTGFKNGCEGHGEVTVNVNGSFNLETSGDQSICAGQSVEICASGADGYWWSNGKDKRCITVSPDHTKTYSVTGVKNGCEASSHVTVNVNGSISLDTSHDPTICAGQSVEICASGADGYWWSNGKGKRCITVSPSHTKTYSVTGFKNGCEGHGEVTVNVNGSFSLETSDDQSICAGQSVEICGSGADGYWWSNGKDKRCITVSPSHTKTYSVTGFKNGCEGHGEVTVNVNGSLNFETSDDQSICAGQSVEICGSGADGYWWSNGKGKRCITVSPSHTKTYSVTGFKNGCEGHGEVTVNVNGSFNLDVSANQSICKGESVKICAENADGYWWSNGEDKPCITVSPNHTKTYSVKAVKNGCEANRDVKVEVKECSNNNSCSSSDLNLHETYISAHDADLKWNKVDGASYTFNIRAVGDWDWFTHHTTDHYLGVSGLSKCASYEWAIMAHCSNGAKSPVSKSTEFSTCGHKPRLGNASLSSGSISVTENSGMLELSPNPVSNVLVINYTGLNIKQLNVYNTAGQLIETIESSDAGSSIVNTTKYEKGMYMILAKGNDKLIKNSFIIQ